VAAGPAVACPVVAQATIDMVGRVLRAQAAGQTMRGHRQMADRERNCTRSAPASAAVAAAAAHCRAEMKDASVILDLP